MLAWRARIRTWAWALYILAVVVVGQAAAASASSRPIKAREEIIQKTVKQILEAKRLGFRVSLGRKESFDNLLGPALLTKATELTRTANHLTDQEFADFLRNRLAGFATWQMLDFRHLAGAMKLQDRTGTKSSTDEAFFPLLIVSAILEQELPKANLDLDAIKDILQKQDMSSIFAIKHVRENLTKLSSQPLGESSNEAFTKAISDYGEMVLVQLPGAVRKTLQANEKPVSTEKDGPDKKAKKNEGAKQTDRSNGEKT